MALKGIVFKRLHLNTNHNKMVELSNGAMLTTSLIYGLTVLFDFDVGPNIFSHVPLRVNYRGVEAASLRSEYKALLASSQFKLFQLVSH